MNVQDAIALAQNCGGLLIPRTEEHFVMMMQPTAKRYTEIDGKVAYQGHKWMDALGRIPKDRRDTYVDIGAHCGLWAWFVSKYFKNTMAFEAAPLHSALFRANIYDGVWEGEWNIAGRYNSYAAHGNNHGTVILHECALGAEQGVISIECAADETGSAHVAQGDGGDTRRGHGELITYPDISMFPLDEFSAPGRVDFVKIDVEGYELQVVQGAEKFLKLHKPWMIVEQKGNDTIYGGKKDEAVTLLKSWGWKDEKVISGDHCMSPPS